MFNPKKTPTDGGVVRPSSSIFMAAFNSDYTPAVVVSIAESQPDDIITFQPDDTHRTGTLETIEHPRNESEVSMCSLRGRPPRSGRGGCRLRGIVRR